MKETTHGARPGEATDGRPPELDVRAVLPGEAATLEAAQQTLRGARTGMRGIWPFLGPAFVAAVAYIDPGNFATNIAGGAKYGYLLLWVVLSANLMAMLVQTLSAKLGIATGKNLPETCRDNFPRPVSLALWIQAEAIAMATDLAEVIGAALGLHLLFGMPLFPAALLAGAGAFGILALQRYGFRRLEAAVAALVGVIVVAFAFEVLLAKPDAAEVARHLVVPGFQGTESVLLAVGILGATVMPHVVYLHSALTQKRIEGRNDEEKRRIQRFERIDVIIAMTIAGVVNMSMLAIAAAVFFGAGIESIEDAYANFDTELGSTAAILFGIALLASGFSSSSVGTLAGQVVMQGFINRRIPIFLRRAITLAPALVIIALGVDPSRSLVISQVVLSFGIPFALVPLVIFTSRRNLMGGLVNTRLTTVAAGVVAALIISLNLFLLYETFVG
jgi:manganese transport protein